MFFSSTMVRNQGIIFLLDVGWWVGIMCRNTFITNEDYHSEDSTLPGSSPQPLVREASSDVSDDDEGDYHLRYDEDEEEMQQRGYDSRHHYAFYPEETELEVIPEEDEDHASNSDCSDPMGKHPITCLLIY